MEILPYLSMNCDIILIRRGSKQEVSKLLLDAYL